MIKLTPEFKESIVKTHGDNGRHWLEQLPEIIRYTEQRWAIELEQPYSELSHNYVAPAVLTGGEKIVAKIGVPIQDLHLEIAALKVFNGHGAVKLLDADTKRGILILERLEPGERMSSLLADEQSIEAASKAILNLWQSPPDDERFILSSRWLEGYVKVPEHLKEGLGEYPQDLIDLAVATSKSLLDSKYTPVFMHGDLHHYNLLTATRSPWLIIDPRGVIGDPCFEIGVLFRNFRPELIETPTHKDLLLTRVEQFAKYLSLDTKRLQKWCFCQLNLEAMLCYENKDEHYPTMLDCAKALLEGLN